MSMLLNRKVKRYLKEGIHEVKLIKFTEQAEKQLVPQSDGSVKELSPYIELVMVDDSNAQHNYRFWVGVPEDLDKFDVQVGYIKDQTGVEGEDTIEVLQNLIDAGVTFKIMLAKNYSEKLDKWYMNTYFNADVIESAQI
jgi:hypothetical protein